MHTPTSAHPTPGAATPALPAGAAPASPLGAHAAATLGSERMDLYGGIHKALRLFMTRTLGSVGSADPDDPADVAQALALLDRLLGLCELHLKDENDFVHPALERALPGSAARIAGEHQHHVEAIADLRDLAGLVRDARDAQRPAALGRLYRALALFVADNFQHMHVEETAHNAVLWAHYSDAELLAIEQALVASIDHPDRRHHPGGGFGNPAHGLDGRGPGPVSVLGGGRRLLGPLVAVPGVDQSCQRERNASFSSGRVVGRVAGCVAGRSSTSTCSRSRDSVCCCSLRKSGA